MLGCYSDAPDSQDYLFPLRLFHPSRGDFIAFIGRTADRTFVRHCVASFRRHAKFPGEGAALPGRLPGVDSSDHWSFWQVGYPALMVTDTAQYRYKHYHTEDDTPEKLDYDRVARAVTEREPVIEELTNP